MLKNYTPPSRVKVLLSGLFAGLTLLMTGACNDSRQADISLQSITVPQAAFNRDYSEAAPGEILSWRDPGKAISAVAYHKGLLITPLSFDFGGGIGDGALIAYNVDDARNPVAVFDSRDYPARYHNDENAQHYLGDLGEMHGLYFHNDYLYLSDRGKTRNGFLILDLGPLYDDDQDTLPEVVSRFHFPGVEKSTVYDGFSFAGVWVGGKYVYAPTGSTGLYIVDTTDLKNPRLAAHMTKAQLHNQTLRSAHAIGDTLILTPAAVAVAKGDMVLVDVANPANPTLLGRHSVKVGYQGIVYGSKFYNGGYSGNRGQDKVTEFSSYDFADPQNIIETDLGTTEEVFRPEYIYMKDGDMYIGHYPGLAKFDISSGIAKLMLKAEPQFPPAEDYAFSSPMGNLTIMTSDHDVKSKLNIARSAPGADQTPPQLLYVLPRPGATNRNALTKIGLSFSENMNHSTLDAGAIILREKGSGKIIPSRLSHGMSIVHLIAETPLPQNSSYEVIAMPHLADTVGNAYAGERLLTYFSTGDIITDFTAKITTAPPTPSGQNVTLRAETAGALNLEYSWDFGDGRGPRGFTSNPETQITYAVPGNYDVSLTVRETGGAVQNTISAVQVIHAPLPKARPQSSSTLAQNEDGSRLYVINPDNNTLSAFDAWAGSKLWETEAWDRPVSVALINSQIWVVNRASSEIAVYNSSGDRLSPSVQLGRGSAPHGIISTSGQERAYVVLSARNEIVEIDTQSYKVTRRIAVSGPLRDLAYSPKNDKIYAPQYIASDQKGAKLNIIDRASWLLESSNALEPSLDRDGLSNGRGYPNYLAAPAINPEQTYLWIPGKKDNLFRGLQRDGKPLTFDHTVRSMAAQFDVVTGMEIKDTRIDLDNSDFAVAATYNALGNIMYIATMGSQTITAVDAYNPQNQSIYSTYGQGTASLLSSPDGTRLYVHNQLSRTINVFKSAPDGSLTFDARLSTVAKEALPRDILDGKQKFHNSAQSHLSREGYMSCASCHMDGGHDGRIWDFTSLGEGLRNTIDLRGKEGMKHGPLHWTANFDEIQDFNNQIVKLNGGTGFLFDAIKPAHTRHFKSKAGVNIELDNLAKYISSLNTYPQSPHRAGNGEITAAARQGRQHFTRLGCVSCHSGETYTDSVLGVRHDVGTQTVRSGTRVDKAFNGFDTPSLIGIWDSEPYLHDGSAKTLEDVFTAGNGSQAKAHQVAGTLSKTQRAELVDFLKQLDSEGPPARQGDKLLQGDYRLNYIYKFEQSEQIIGVFPALPGKDLVYEILPSVYSNLFEINPKSGVLKLRFKDIYLRNISNMALDINRNYNLKIALRDEKTQEISNTANALITVTYPKIPITTKELNKLIKYNHMTDIERKINPNDRAVFNDFKARIVKGRAEIISSTTGRNP